MRDRVAVSVKDAGEERPPTRCNDSLVEDLASGEVGVQVDVGRQDEVLVVVFGRLAQGDQIRSRGDLVWVVRLTRAAAVFGVSRQYKQARYQG